MPVHTGRVLLIESLMRSVCQAWPSRLISSVTALALIVASAIGAFGHAAAHADHSPLHVSHAHGVATAPAATDAGHGHAGYGHAGCDHEKGEKGQPHANCCDTICHGGQAVLTSALALPLPVVGATFFRPSASLHSKPPGCLERPPRSPVLA